jgi:phosphoribosyl 1,2-cyclic phosphodiesterase
MQIISLQSGSNGNCIYVEAGGARLLFDAGISAKTARQRLAEHQRDIAQVDAVIISHDHSDHASRLGVFQRVFGLPVYVTAPTLQAAARRSRLGELAEVYNFHSGDTLRFGGVSVETIPTPHDGVDGVAFVVDDGTHRLGILTDLGHVFDDLRSAISSLDGVLLESNYDAEMLDDGPYPDFLKRRIRGPGGHISNVEAAELIAGEAAPRLKWVCLAHLSHENNTAELALHTHRKVLGPSLPIQVAGRHAAAGIFEL